MKKLICEKEFPDRSEISWAWQMLLQQQLTRVGKSRVTIMTFISV